MNKILLILTFTFVLSTSFSQEEIGEGDIYIQNLKKYDTVVETSNVYIVDYLFSKLSLDEVKLKAKDEKKGYFIDFTADWCTPCKMMDQTTFRDYDVVKYTQENYYAVQLDMSDFDAIEMQAMYKIVSLPTILFFDYNSKLIGRATGLQTGTLFLKKLKEINSLS